MATKDVDFIKELEKREKIILSYLMAKEFREWFSPEHITEAVYCYLNRKAKRLRPAVLLFACGAVGGKEEDAISAAAGIEMFHTWTLVHDDLIDNDEKRRGGYTVHKYYSMIAKKKMKYSESGAKDYGRDIAILTGDVQQGWAVALFCDCFLRDGVKPKVGLTLIQMLESQVLNTLVSGETLDIQFAKQPIESLHPDRIIDMLYRKTGVLYEFAGKAGAMIGLSTTNHEDKRVKALSNFCQKCGTAFQLQDDILGVIGDEEQLGKPVGSDIREGKRTTITYFAFKNATPKEKRKLESILGKRTANVKEIKETTRLLIELGGISETQKIAKRLIKEACPELDILVDSHYKYLLLAWAEYMVSRNF
jgi:geranylgeranyl diphosphate synthase type I